MIAPSEGSTVTSQHEATHTQELVVPDVSFVLHTARPRDGNKGVVMAEMAPGQGETLASGTRGTPWRLEVSKSTQQVGGCWCVCV